MTCADYRAVISAHLDGELAAGPECFAHPSICADCAAWLAAARRLRELTLAARGPSSQRSQRLVDAVLNTVAAQGRAGDDGTSVAHEES
ncbi:hypothetical protein [Kitasatospora kifunensis]|uniref:Zinc-finger domain-containing protein n=1 Tax=Kitasatospora kifunensis TaxID=58351 RepID=A0A7W7R954_KITKI|nr:hypothetical protein [Kitasatospora kifunensis]MBB4927604.1 hypothetical protein [Kitasatospora kifunensis]